MKKIIFGLLLFLFAANGVAQDAKIDSLKNSILQYYQKKNHTLKEDTLTVKAYIELGKIYRKNKSDSTLYFATQANKLAEEKNWIPGQILSSMQMGYYYFSSLKQFKNAIFCLDKAQHAMQAYLPNTITDPYVNYQLYSWLGQCHQGLGDNEKALVYFLKCAEWTKKSNLENEYIISLNLTGTTYLNLSNYTASLRSYEEGLTLSLAKNDSVKVAILYGNIGRSYYFYSNYSAALRNYYLAYDIDKALNNTQGQVRHLQNIADVYQRQGEYKQALEIINEVLTIYKNFDYGYGITLALNSLAQICLLQGDYDAALVYGKDALKWSIEINNTNSISSSYTTLGVVLQFMGNYPVALDYFNQAKSISDSIGDFSYLQIYLSNVANLYSSLGFYEKALTYQTDVLKSAQATGNKHLEASTLGNIANLYVKLKDFELALAYNSLAINIAEETNLKAILANTLVANAYVKLFQEDYLASTNYFNEALKISTEMDSKSNISICYSGLCAIQILEGNYDEAYSNGTEGLRFARIAKGPKEIYTALINLYHTFIKTNQPDLALIKLSEIRKLTFNGLETNFFSLSEKEREAYFATLETNLDPCYDFGLFHQKEFPEITDTLYNLVLTTKGLSLKSSTFLRQSILESKDSTLIADYNELIKLRKEIATSVDENDIKQKEELANTLEKKIVKNSGAFSDFEKIKSIDWKQIQQTLKPEECAIEFVNFDSYIDTTGPKIYAALIIKKDSKHPEFIKLCTEAELIEIIGALQGNNLNFVNSVYGTREKAQTPLYDKIWKPLEPSLKNIKTVFYSPTGVLHKISFASLCKSQNVFLADLYNLKQMGSTTNLALNSNTNFDALENFLLMGGVNFNSTRSENEAWSYLPGTLNETDAINAALQEKKFGVNYFTDNNASEEIFKEKISSSNIVHIATHGFFFPDPEQVRAEMSADSENNIELIFRGNNINQQKGTTNYASWSFVNNQNPLMRSGLVLSGANAVWSRDTKETNEDGILTAAEVSNLDLRNTKLVVLSACETGLGDIKGSEGVYGLQRAFKMAGVKYIIMSLWQVPDKETSEFMILFYKNLIKLKDIPLAFQKTQKVMRAKYDPYYWGAFVLIE